MSLGAVQYRHTVQSVLHMGRQQYNAVDHSSSQVVSLFPSANKYCHTGQRFPMDLESKYWSRACCSTLRAIDSNFYHTLSCHDVLCVFCSPFFGDGIMAVQLDNHRPEICSCIFYRDFALQCTRVPRNSLVLYLNVI